MYDDCYAMILFIKSHLHRLLLHWHHFPYHFHFLPPHLPSNLVPENPLPLHSYLVQKLRNFLHIQRWLRPSRSRHFYREVHPDEHQPNILM